MKKNNFLSLFITMSCLFFIAACSNVDKRVDSDRDSTRIADSVKQANEVFANNVKQEKEEEKTRLDIMIKDLDKRIDKIDEDIKHANQKTKLEMDEQKNKLFRYFMDAG